MLTLHIPLKPRLNLPSRTAPMLKIFSFAGLAFCSIASALPAAATAQNQDASNGPIIGDEEFDAKVPALAAPLETIEEWQKREEEKDTAERLSERPGIDPESESPLEPIAEFNAEPLVEPADLEEGVRDGIRYETRIDGLQSGDAQAVAEKIKLRFDALSILKQGDGKAENAAVVSVRMSDDQDILQQILESEGFFDARVDGAIERPSESGEPVVAVLTIEPGRRYVLGQIFLDAPPVQPANLLTNNFSPKSGDPIVADVILSAEAALALILPQNGYPFAAVGERDILLDEDTAQATIHCRSSSAHAAILAI